MKKKCLLFLLLSACGLQAQSKNTGNDSLVYYHNQVTISASRYAETIDKIPYSVSIIEASKLSALKGNGLDEALSSVPGVLAQSRAGSQDVRIVIRGFGARGAGDRSNSGTSRGIRIMSDGIPETEPDGRTSFDLIDLSLAGKVDVVRSNTSALWGNAAGGVINISAFPDMLTPSSELKFYSGSFGFEKMNFQSFTQSEGLKIAAGFSISKTDGWRNHSASKRSILNIALKNQLSESSTLGVFLIGSSSIFHIPGPLNIDQYNSDAQMANTDYEKRDERRYNRLGRIGVTFDYALSENLKISSMAFVNPKYLQRSERNTYRDFTRYHTGGNFMLTINSKIAGMENKTITGIDEAYQDGAILFYALTADNNRGALKTNKREGANNIGLFISNELAISERINFLLGIRYDNITYYSDDYSGDLLGTQKKSYEKLSPKAGIVWQTGVNTNIFASFSMGVEAPAGNETDPAPTFGQDTVYRINPLLNVIRSTTFETGFRYSYYSLPVNKDIVKNLNFNISLYNINTYDDIIPYKSGKFYFSAGKTRRTGVEVGADVQLISGIGMNTALTWSMNKYIDYKVDSVHYKLSKAGHYAVYDDNKIAGTPEFFYNTAFSYKPVFLPLLVIGLGFNGISKYYADDANTIEVPAYFIVNGSVGISDIHLYGNFYLDGLFSVNNILDKKYAASAFNNPDLDSKGKPVYLESGLPINYCLSLSVAFR